MPNKEPAELRSECANHYRNLYETCGEILSQSFSADEVGVHSDSHHYALDLEEWINILSSRPELPLLIAALREYQFGLLALVLGQYRQAFMALRLFLELGLSGVLFSANELDFRLWLGGSKDIVWNRVVDPESGVFSKTFVRAFFESLEDEAPQYKNIAESVFRECSEYVHGNAYTHNRLPDSLRFEQNIFFDWHEKAKSARVVLSFALSLRYLHFVDKTSLRVLEPIIVDDLGHISAIRALLGGTTEEN